jgi:hypothetical protein
MIAPINTNTDAAKGQFLCQKTLTATAPFRYKDSHYEIED